MVKGNHRQIVCAGTATITVRTSDGNTQRWAKRFSLDHSAQILEAMSADFELSQQKKE